MCTDDIAREQAAAAREQASAIRELAAAVRDLAARMAPAAADMDAQALMDLAWKRRLEEPPAFAPNTHQGRVERQLRRAMAMTLDDGA